MTKTQDQSPKTKDVAAIVLAAGRSERMGAFKPLLPFGPRTVVEGCIRNLRDGGVETIVVVIGQNARAELLKAHLAATGVVIAVNPEPGSEMSASIVAGVGVLPASTQAILITPVDHAAIPGEVVSRLIDEWVNGAKLVKPTWNNRGGHPVLIDMQFREELLNLDPERGLKALFQSHLDQVSRLPVSSDYVARDMDTWDDYRTLHLEVFGVPPPELPARDRADTGE
ncbi:MAG TPA: nucleotidyltransferase family protein [Pyrinomonadaceae bacterium]|jgi:CTP:molybdopterin cytidylyltransferase MocA